MTRFCAHHPVWTRCVGTLVACFVAASGAAVEIDLQPADYAYLNRVDAAQPHYDVLLWGLRLRNPATEAVDVTRLEVRAVDDDGRLSTRRLAAPPRKNEACARFPSASKASR